MLDYSKMALLVQQSHHKFLMHKKQPFDQLKQLWEGLCTDQLFLEKIQAGNGTLNLHWQGKLNDCIAIELCSDPATYTVFGIDGSQVYPDKHRGLESCFLVNSGGCLLKYGQHSTAKFFSDPELYFFDDLLDDVFQVPIAPEGLVDLVREEQAFSWAWKQINMVPLADEQKLVTLYDGTLLFFDRAISGSKPTDLHLNFLQKYLKILEHFYQVQQLLIGYISLPKSRALAKIIQAYACPQRAIDGTPCSGRQPVCCCRQLAWFTDADLFAVCLKPGERSPLFFQRALLTTMYPAHLRICFWYLHVGSEVVRLEAPAWIARDAQLIALICQVVLDQASKGFGYPVALAEAHEQAVIKVADHEIFYQMINKMNPDDSRQQGSLKAFRKRFLPV